MPPGAFGWPLVGETYQLLFKNIENFIQERAEKHSSEIFKTNLFGEPTVVMFGPAANKFLSINESKLVKVWYMKSQCKLFNLPDQNQNQTQVGVASPPVKVLGLLKHEGIIRYMGNNNNIESIIQKHFITHWEGKTELKVYPLVKSFSISLAFQFFLGTDETHYVDKFATKFENLFSGIYSVPMDFPGSTYHRAIKGASEIRKEIQYMIKDKIEGLSKGKVMDGLLAHIVDAEKSGKYVPKIEISNTIMGLMNASYISIATTLAFMIKHIGLSPHIYQRIISEHADIKRSSKESGTSQLDWDSIQKLKYTWAVALESMRLYSPAPGAFREAKTDFTYEGFTIPKGWKIFWAFIGTNKNPKYFDKPESFDPSRFEGNNVLAPYTYIPFGSGPRSCPGKDYTRLAILTFIHNLVTKFKWEVMLPDEEVSGAMIPIPTEGIPIRLHHLF
ncbi:cytochrome P450 family protein [Medicago truncatula]|uniref:Cytochrome P450 family protein n=3 Tax=Medicago truncatula TaxID=3880 RepID=G7L9K3_MEDTR|nr:cytochrome P450 family protein [Medicago truncatula]